MTKHYNIVISLYISITQTKVRWGKKMLFFCISTNIYYS